MHRRLIVLFFGLPLSSLTHNCTEDTGGTCTFFACDPSRNAYCGDGLFMKSCMCRAGSCAVDGACQVDIQTAFCGGVEWEMANVRLTVSTEGCVFRKVFGQDHGIDGYAQSALPNVASMSFCAPGGLSERTIGFTSDPDDTASFAKGGYVTLDSIGRGISPGGGFNYAPNAADEFNFTYRGGQGIMAVAKNSRLVGSFAAPGVTDGRSLYARIIIQDKGAEVTVNKIGIARNCTLSEWTGTCSATCGSGMATLERHVVATALGGGLPCVGPTKKVVSCFLKHCPEDCVWNGWSGWSACSTTCNGGSQTRKRTLVHPARYNGTCNGASDDQRACGTEPCPPVDCEWSQWSKFGSCSVTCGTGVKVRSRSVTVLSQYGGKECNGASSVAETCEMEDCPDVHVCSWSVWGEWSPCTATCGRGQRHRVRTLDVIHVKECEGAVEETDECAGARDECPPGPTQLLGMIAATPSQAWLLCVGALALVSAGVGCSAMASYGGRLSPWRRSLQRPLLHA